MNTVSLVGSPNAVILEEPPGCLVGNGINLTSTANIPSETQVRYYVSTDFGFNHFRNHGVAVLLGADTTLDEIPSSVITANTAAAGTSVPLPGLCVADDRIDPRPVGNTDGSTNSGITVRLMSVAGFRIDRNRDSAKAFVRGNDQCTRPDGNALNGGVVYKFRNGNLNDSCVCSEKSLVEVTPHDSYTPLKPGRGGLNRPAVVYGEIPTYGQSSLNWTNDSTDYCEDSPYSGREADA
ncbi:MAG: hypothetical protein OXF73_08705 [Gammaproteobacteria bacterium]|nr:hypothetical protein [Gammaproteobacteria bacterium]